MMLVKETYINETRGHMIGETEFYEPWTDNKRRLFRDYQREYGRCISRMYVDGIDGKPRPIGWVFGRREQYEDSGRYGRKPEYYQREVWVEIREIPGYTDES